MSFGSQNDETPRTEALMLAERRWLEQRGLLGEQPEEPPCRCPRNCWCQGEAAS